MFPVTVCPATCELCGNWLPQHQTSCPRNGVHPSQWTCSSSTFDILTSIEQQQQQQPQEEDSLFSSLSLLKKDNHHDESLL